MDRARAAAVTADVQQVATSAAVGVGVRSGCAAAMLRTAILMLTTLTFVTACADVYRRTVLVADPEQPICVPIPAELMSSVGNTTNAEPYYITVGQAELESTTPRDDIGASDDIYAFLRRRDPAIEERVQKVVDRRQRLATNLKSLVAEREQLAAQDGDTDAIDERILEAEEALDRLRVQESELRQLVSGRTPTLSRVGTRISFNDWAMPFRVHEGDTVEVRIIERDPFQNDLLGHTNVIVDSVMLDTGRVELRTGWVQSLSLGFVPCDEDGDADL